MSMLNEDERIKGQRARLLFEKIKEKKAYFRFPRPNCEEIEIHHPWEDAFKLDDLIKSVHPFKCSNLDVVFPKQNSEEERSDFYNELVQRVIT